jgi:hypothetical protein
MRKPGCTEPVYFFVNRTDPNHPPGYLMMSPYSDCPAPPGYTLESVDTLPAIRRLEKMLQRQEHQRVESEVGYERSMLEQGIKENRDRIYRQLASSETSQWEKDFLRDWIKLRDEKRDEYFQQRYLEHQMMLWALHNDTPKNRQVDKEKVSLDRIG